MTTPDHDKYTPRRLKHTKVSGYGVHKAAVYPMGYGVPQSTVDFFVKAMGNRSKDRPRVLPYKSPPIRSTPLQVLDHCPRKFLYEYKLGLRPRSYRSALSFGTVVHKVLQCMFLGQTAEEAVSVCESLLAKEQQNLISAAGPDGFLPTGEAIETILKKLEEDHIKARATGLAFWQFVPFEKDRYEVVRGPDGTPLAEVVLETKYSGLSQPIRATCDLALRDKRDGGIWIVDYKTTSFDPRKRAIPTKISAQLALYRLVLQTKLNEWFPADKPKVVGSLHAIIKKPGIKFCGKDADFNAFVDRLIQWYKDADAKDPDNPPMILDPNRFSGPLMSQELWSRLHTYCRCSRSSPDINSFWRAGESACLQYNQVCPFMPLCASDPAMWPDIVEQRFDVSFREDEENVVTDL